MVVVGYHASHEQHPPSALLRHVRQAGGTNVFVHRDQERFIEVFAESVLPELTDR